MEVRQSHYIQSGSVLNGMVIYTEYLVWALAETGQAILTLLNPSFTMYTVVGTVMICLGFVRLNWWRDRRGFCLSVDKEQGTLTDVE